MREEPWRKTALQHTTVVWYGGSCTNKRNKLEMCDIHEYEYYHH